MRAYIKSRRGVQRYGVGKFPAGCGWDLSLDLRNLRYVATYIVVFFAVGKWHRRLSGRASGGRFDGRYSTIVLNDGVPPTQILVDMVALDMRKLKYWDAPICSEVHDASV
jgi:hypothetical protein